jgi:hypothetical protein
MLRWKIKIQQNHCLFMVSIVIVLNVTKIESWHVSLVLLSRFC